jgi:TPP-dependent pyruvate/acetoin dehydrogenase alpha subunit
METTTTKAKKNKVKYSRDLYLKWYEEMLLMRRFEEKAGQLYGMQKIKGFCHLYIGQEAVVAGAMSVLKPTDAMITAYRDHAHALGKGISAREVMAELYGKITGCSKGKGGSMHMFSKPHKFFGGHGIVGAQIPLGAGIAFSEKYNNTGNINLYTASTSIILDQLASQSITLTANNGININASTLINGTINVASPISFTIGFNSFIKVDICFSFFF